MHTATISATGTGKYKGTISIALTISITKKSLGDVTYGAGNTVAVSKNETAYTVAPQWSDSDPTVGYAKKEGTVFPDTVPLDAATGVLTINGAEVPSPTTVSITATATGNYDGSKPIDITITSTSLVLAGSFSYHKGASAQVEYGGATATEYVVEWRNEPAEQLTNISYSISPKTTGITIDGDGKISVAADTAVQTATEYTITAQGKGSYAGKIEATISIQIMPKTVAGTLTYNGGTAVSSIYGDGASYAGTWASAPADQTVGYSISPATAGITIDSDGKISVVADTAVQAETEYTITTAGRGNYKDSKSFTMRIAVAAKSITGTLSYKKSDASTIDPTVAETIIYGTATSYVAAWAGGTIGQTLSYTISPSTAGITVSAAGTVTVASTATAQAKKEYTTTATGKGNYGGVAIEAKITIAIIKTLGTLSYGDSGNISVFSTDAAYEVPAQWDAVGITADYAIDSAVAI